MAADLFKALADPTRRAILDELSERNGQTLFELCARLATRYQLASSRQAISQHIDLLVAAGLLRTRREGRYTFHDLDPTPLDHLLDRWLAASHPRSIADTTGDSLSTHAVQDQPDQRPGR